MPSAKKALSGSRLRFSKGKTATLFSGAGLEVTVAGKWEAAVACFWSVGFKREGAKMIAATAKATSTRPLIAVAAKTKRRVAGNRFALACFACASLILAGMCGLPI